MSMDQAKDVASTFDRVLSAVLLHPDTTAADLNYFSDRNKERVREWNQASLEAERRCIHEVIQDHVASRPNAEAVCAWDGSLTFLELSSLASRLAQQLVNLGAGPDMIIPLCFDKSKWNPVAMLAVLKAGAAFVSLDPAHPVPRLQGLAQRVGAKIVLCSYQHAESLSAISETVLPVNNELMDKLADISCDKGSRAKWSDRAYIIFTSGTTGEPKGTIISHGAFCSSAKAHGPAMLTYPESRVLQFAAHTFDASLVEILTPLMVGGCVCIPSEEARLNDVAGAINAMQVNWAVLTPSFIGFLEPSAVPGLKTLVLAGEAMSRDQITTWSKINLVNGYGPSECAVASVVNFPVTHEAGPTNIGRAVGTRCWVADQYNHDKLVPVGCIGELLIEGPTLAQGYLDDPEKTSGAFIHDPLWARSIGDTGQPRRMYKTGDLVKQNSSDGTFNFVGRKDTQVKFNGQRIELGEIEHHLNVNKNFQHGIVLLPKSGYCAKRIVAVLSLSPSLVPSSTKERHSFNVVEGEEKEIADSLVSSLRESLSHGLPAYMIPSIMLVVESIPLLSSGKLDRKETAQWVNDIDEELYGLATGTTDADDPSTKAATNTESIVQRAWSRVLNLPVERVSLDRSFLSLGGDSISAMQVMRQCQKKGVRLTVQDVIRSKSIAQLALCATEIQSPSQCAEPIEVNFDLSPIQKLYFDQPDQGQTHFNQSFFLRITRQVSEQDMRSAIETVINRHSMLRARFSRNSTTGTCQQRVTKDIASSYRFRHNSFDAAEQAISTIAESQASLNVVNGPVFAVDLFNISGGDQLVFMVGHHLVIDLVSWRIILEDVEELLMDPGNSLATDAPLPFQTWCHLQAEHCKSLHVDQVLPIEDVPAGDGAYWGMVDRPNTYGDVVSEGFELESTVTSMLLTKCHEALSTETVDLLLTALVYSFGQVFTDRSAPPIYNEGHGREVWDSNIDLSKTVGWFTVMYPVCAPQTSANDLLETTRRIKDLRRQMPGNGRPYFASRLLTEEGQERFGHHWPLEVTFNYLGLYQQLEREGALLIPAENMAGEARGAGGIADVGHLTPRFGLFEISAVVAQEKLRFSFTFNRHMNHQDKIRAWVSKSERALHTLANELSKMKPERTLSDFPQLALTHDQFKMMTTEKLPRIGVNMDEVEDIYPCSQMQQGLMLSLTKDTAFYGVQVVSRVNAKDSKPVDCQRLARAWQAVVDRHAALRTIFVEGFSQDNAMYDQIVLKHVNPDLVQLERDTDDAAVSHLNELQPASNNDGRRPPHRFTICQTSTGNVYCKLEINHTIMDGNSMSILFRDLGHAYEGLLPAGQKPLYSEYIAYLRSQPTDISLEFWRTYLDGMEPCLFPILNEGRSVEKKLHSVQMTFTDLRGLQNFCDSHNVTLSNAIHTAWALTLRCYTGVDKVCFGYLTSSRDAPIEGAEDAVGPFINMLACAVDMAGAVRVSDVIDQLQRDYANSLPHRNTPLAEVQHALRLSDSALFNTALSYRRLPSAEKGRQPAIDFEECAPIYDPTEYNVSINVETSDEDAFLTLDYWTDCLSDGQAANVAETYLHSLQNIARHWDQQVKHLDNLGKKTKAQITAWNSQIPEFIDDCVHDVVERHVQEQPDAPAVSAWDAAYTYKELSQLSERLAHHLVGLGIGPETLVPTCFDKSAWTIVAMLGVLKAGGACVPLDATHPKSAIERRVRDTQAQHVLAAPERADIFDDMVPHVVAVDSALLDTLPKLSHKACTVVKPNNPSFVMYTSGSTGQPKGVVLEHRAIVTSSNAYGSAIGFCNSSRVLQFAAYTFDNSLEEMFTTLMFGGCVCVPSDHDRLNNLASVINRLEVNLMDITPTVASFLEPSEVPKLKGLVLGGEALTKKVVEMWSGNVSLYGMYGPSECSVNCAFNGDIEPSGEVTNLGRAIGSVSWVVDPSDYNQLVPIGCTGELLVEGPILARCYLNDPEKTSKSFIENPAWLSGVKDSSGPTRRMYRTGDLVRYNSDGTMTYLGRKDTQVKLNGQRIEVGEIEHHVKRNLPSQAQSAVELISVTGSQRTTKALAAFLCLESDGSVPAANDADFLLPMTESISTTAKALEATLLEAIQSYMVPHIFFPVVQMPMTASGKLDRRCLRTAAEALSEEKLASYRLAGTSGRAPSTDLEKQLQRLWASVLKLQADSIGVDDNFFRLGGDSISAMQLVTASRGEGVLLSVASIFQKPKLLDMAVHALTTSNGIQPDSVQPAIRPFALVDTGDSLGQLIKDVASQCQVEEHDVEDIYPCTSIQEGLVALSIKEPGTYVAQSVYRLSTEINIAKFKEAWEAVVNAEAVLRTRIVYTKARGFLQVVVREPIRWQSMANLQGLEEAGRQIPSYNGGSLREYAIVGENTHDPHFVWTVHHALYDGWSMPLIHERVETFYKTGKLVDPALGASYSRFISYLADLDVTESDNFWKSNLSESSSRQFPQLPYPAYQTMGTNTVQHSAPISKESKAEVTMSSKIRAAWALAVAAYSESDDVIFGETVTGRDAPVPGIADMVGPTLATIPRRLNLDRGSSIEQLLMDVQQQSAEAMPYQFAGLQHINKLNDDTSLACAFQNLIAINHATQDCDETFWNPQNGGTIGNNFFTYPLTLSFTINDATVDIEAHYDQNILPKWQAESLLYCFEMVLGRLDSQTEASVKLGEIEILSAQDRETISRWNSQPLRAVEECVHQVIEKQTRSLPVNTPAVCSWDGNLTYRELDERSLGLAGYLSEKGIKENVFVPLCFDKSAWTIVAMLAVLKAGGAFVPLDPTHPVSRLQGIIDDVGAKVVLCSPQYEELARSVVGQAIAIDQARLDRLAAATVSLPPCASESPAYVIFTSGTTGKPKGTIVGHSAFCTGAAAHGSAMGMQSSSRVLQFASYTFDASIMEILTTLTFGGCVCVPNEKDRLGNIADTINSLSVNWTLLTPSFVQTIQPSSIPGLKTLVLGGEAMSQGHISTWSEHVKLLNAYGPSETAVVATVNPCMSSMTNPANMGWAVGGRCWLVDPKNSDRLMPVGTAGELLVEGPILAQGYLHEDKKTADAFIKSPAWAKGLYGLSFSGERRFYKTGDLVRYNEDGSMLYLGRKDTQVKVRGQRLELGEVEFNLATDPYVKHAVVAMPLSGHCGKRLTAILSFQNASNSDPCTDGLRIVGKEETSSHLSSIRERLGSRLPVYMIPAKWIVLRDLPLLPSGKLDRRQVVKFVEDMNDQTYHQISDVEAEEKSASLHATGVERQLQGIFAYVLNLPLERIGLHQSFLHLGGDSITAMQIMAHCRAEYLGLTVQDVIRSKSIAELASRVTLPQKRVEHMEEIDSLFDLSPIQQLYFEAMGGEPNHFNQSVLLRLTKYTTAQEVLRAVETIAQSHSMLRSRFSKPDSGDWRQKVVHDIKTSYRFRSHEADFDQVASLVEHSQVSLDVQNGPTFAVDLFDVGGSVGQILSIAAHHLVIDVVSWRIILQDLEDLLTSGTSKTQGSLTFQAWCRLQEEHTRQEKDCRLLTNMDDVPVSDLEYWGMADMANTHGEAVDAGFELNAKTTLLLLGACNDPLQTDIVDVCLAAMFKSFSRVFYDRTGVPAVFNEGHGREPWDPHLDLSRTVGWFTTMSPVYMPSDSIMDDDIINTIRWVKDLRRREPDKGREYFAYRLLTNEGKQRFRGHWPMEISFNYLGQYQQLERKDALLQPLEDLSGRSINTESDIGRDVPRFALIETSASITQGSLKVTFSFNRHMKRQDGIKQWISEYQKTIQAAVERLIQMKNEPTLSDFPLLPLTYNGLANLAQKLPQMGLSSLDELEDAYPCSPMQQGILFSQLKNPNLYNYRFMVKLRPTEQGQAIHFDRLEDAWRAVVERHASLRTVFINNVSQQGLMDQGVLKTWHASVERIECKDSEAVPRLESRPPLKVTEPRPPHRFTIAKTSITQVYCMLDISHAISDGTSMPILLRDLTNAYAGKLTDGNGAPRFSDYIAHIQSSPRDADMNYWKSYLADIEPCYFPALGNDKDAREVRTLVLQLTKSSILPAFCAKHGLTTSNVLQFVWALVLRCYTNSNDICFGYLVSGRDAPIQGIQDAVGAFINILVCRMSLGDGVQLGKALEQVQTDFVRSMAHQNSSLADIQHELHLSGTPLFNTAFTYQRRRSSNYQAEPEISYDVLDAHDPSEYSITINVEALDSGVEVHFNYWTDVLSAAQASNMASTFDHVLNSIISETNVESSIGELDYFGEESRQQVMKWNKHLPPTVDDCVHRIVEQQSRIQPISKHAVFAWDANLTYKQLDRLAARLASRLVALGVRLETCVPICFEKSAWTIVAMLGVMKAGGAFVPLDPTHPVSRWKHIVESVDAKLVLCSSQYQVKFSEVAETTFVVDSKSIGQRMDGPSTSTPEGPSPQNAAYIIFTSGTTGLPKGTIIEHAAFCTSATEHAKAMFMGPESRVFQFANYTFDASIMEILSTLIVGGCVCVPNDQERMSDIPGAIERMKVNWTLLTPSVAKILDPSSVPSLKVLVTGGEAMSSGHIAKWRGKVALINAYGPSETSVIATTSTKVDEDGFEVNGDTGTIGGAIGGRNWVVDPRNYNRLTPVGGIGELLVEGRHVARGYLKNEQKTAEAFVSEPEWRRNGLFGDLDGRRERMYRTGDLVRYNSDGTLNYISRKDTQVKFNGQRIELGEIEHHVRTNLPEEMQSAVELVVPASRNSTKALSVFFCSQNDNPDATSQPVSILDELLLPMSDRTQSMSKALEGALNKALPAYMVPTIYVPLTRMPWTSSGKLDRHRLRNIVQMLSRDEILPYKLAGFQKKRPPVTAMEKKVAKQWESILNVAAGSIGLDDNFFRLGGDSIAAMRLINAMSAERISLTVVEVFEKPTLATMAEACTVLKGEGLQELKPFSLLKGDEAFTDVMDELATQCQVDRTLIQDAYPCSSLQEGLITLSIKHPGSYAAQNAFRLNPNVDLERFKAAWQKTVDEIDILRTRIVHMKSSAFLQAVLQGQPIDWRTEDSLEASTSRALLLPAQNGSPLTQYTIIQGSSHNERYFVWGIHHALYDGWSMPMVLERVKTNYAHGISTAPRVSYARFVKYLLQNKPEASDSFWKSKLSGASPLHFPQASPSASEQARNTRMLTYTASLSRDSSALEITTSTIIRAAWALVVAAYTGSEDVVFGQTLAGRDIPVQGVTDVIGPTLTTVPTRIKVNNTSSIPQFLHMVQKLASEMIPHQHAGLQHIKRLSSDTAKACDFQNLLVIQPAESKSEDELWAPHNDGAGVNFFTYPLILECKYADGKVEILAHHDDNLISTWQVQRLLYQFDSVLNSLGSVPKKSDKRLNEVPVFSTKDIEALRSWNRKNERAGISVKNVSTSKDKRTGSDHQSFGAGSAWIVNQNNYQQLAPLGSVGELLLEGAELAKKYKDDSSDSSTMYIEAPAWISAFTEGTSGHRRIFKTGELASYDSEGTLVLQGKKDEHVQLNGKRMELGEIENHLESDDRIGRSAVLLPTTGYFKDQLVTVLALKDQEEYASSPSALELLQEELLDMARSQVSEAKAQLSKKLPQSLIPNRWIVVQAIPQTASGKLDRKKTTEWICNADEETYEQILGQEKNENASDETGPATIFGKVMRQIYSRVLDIPVGEVKLDQSFLNLGGDSITAMQVMAQCRKEKINISLHEIIRSQSIMELEQSIGSDQRAMQQGDKSDEEKLDTLFELSPIQQLYFQSVGQPNLGDRFNQSYLLRLGREISAEDIENAVRAIVGQHSMLRARFTKDASGVWKQRITGDVESSYRYNIHGVNKLSGINPMVADSQSCLDVQNGPLFAADLFNIEGYGQVVFLVAHHLVVDIVSWNNIIQDLEELLDTGALLGDKPLPFQHWASMQADNAQERNSSGDPKVLPFEVAPADLKYWGMVGKPNAYSDVDSESFQIDEAITKLALDECHKSLKTDLVDLFLGVIVHSFSRAFKDRSPPAVFNEGHGRESFDPSIDISRTVGWFTTITPAQVPVNKEMDSVVDTVKRMKDTRRRIPENGRPYFAHRFLTLDGRKKYKDHMPMEIAFNYLGRMTGMQRDDSLLQKIDFDADEESAKSTADVSSNAPRFALFEVSAFVARGQIQFSFNYNRRVRHQDGIRQWFTECKQTFGEAVTRLAQMQPQPTLSDYPIMPITYDKLEKLTKEVFPKHGLTHHDQVENVYPCSPMQEGLLLAQFVDPNRYLCFTIVEVKPTRFGGQVDGRRLVTSWQKVVDRHAALRTVFIDSVYQGDAFNQIVVKHGDSGAIYMECDDNEALDRLGKIRLRETNLQKKPGLPHQLSVAQTSQGKVFLKIEINHAVIDGESAFLLMRDLALAYEGKLQDGLGPLYGDYIAYIKSQPPSADVRFWRTYLKGVQPCFFPQLNEDPSAERQLGSVNLAFDRFPELQDLCKRLKVTLANVMQSVWAFVLRKFVKTDDVCFGYLTSGRDAPISGIGDAIGAYINMLVCRVKFSATSSLEETFQKVQNDYLQSLPYQHCSLAQMQHDLDFSGNMFNTAVSIQNTGAEGEEAKSALEFIPLNAHDPSEVSFKHSPSRISQDTC